MTRYLLAALVGALASASCFPVHAWSAQGHRLVAAVAETRLSPEARAEVNDLLEGEAVPTLPGIAAWADELRDTDPVLGRRASGWHYINMGEENCEYVAATQCKDGNCVIGALNRQLALLATPSLTREARAQALKFVVHFVGDMHQPLHAGYGHDRGGNTFQVRYDNRGTNLHALWDGGMFYPLKLDDSQYLERLLALPAPDIGSGQPTAPSTAVEWTIQTCRLAISPGLYPKNRKVGFPGMRPRIDSSYVETYRPVAEAQLRLAGERLAVMLNNVLGSDHPSR